MHTKNECPSLARGYLQQGAEAVGELQRSHAWVLQLVTRARGEHRVQMSLLCRQTRSYAEAQPSQSFPPQQTEVMARSFCGLIHAQHPLCVTSSAVLHAVYKTDKTLSLVLYWIYWINDLIWSYCVSDLSLKNTQRKTATVGTDIHLCVKNNVVYVGLGCMSQFLKLWITDDLILV